MIQSNGPKIHLCPLPAMVAHTEHQGEQAERSPLTHAGLRKPGQGKEGAVTVSGPAEQFLTMLNVVASCHTCALEEGRNGGVPPRSLRMCCSSQSSPLQKTGVLFLSHTESEIQEKGTRGSWTHAPQSLHLQIPGK